MQNTAKPQILLTGIKPTGTIHVGNYAGAIKPLLTLLQGHSGPAYCFIADIHALNSVHKGAGVHAHSLKIAATMLALGLDAGKVAFFRQSAVREHAELATLLGSVTGKGLMERGHAFKAMVAANEAEGKDRDAGVNMGMFNYPILMAADIILYQSTTVPVGRDQRQHVEFARDIAGSFNARYGDTFTLPDYDAQNPGPEINGLDGRKMSKSYGNIIPLFAPEEELRKTVMRIVTDSKLPDEPKETENSTIIQLYRQFAAAEQIADMEARFTEGRIGYGDAKKELFAVMNSALTPARQRYEELLTDTAGLERILAEGAAKARPVAEKTMSEVRRKMGLSA